MGVSCKKKKQQTTPQCIKYFKCLWEEEVVQIEGLPF